MVKYIIGSLIVLYIYNTYLVPISRRVLQKRGYDTDTASPQQKQQQQKPRPGEYLEYEEIKDE